MNTVYWITAAAPHRIAIIARPRGYDWLESEIRNVRTEGVDVVVSLLTPKENTELGLLDEERSCTNAGIRFFSLPIEDRSVPNDERKVRRLLDALVHEENSGRGIGFHCRAGIGRSSILVALLLARLGWAADKAFATISRARGCHVPDTAEQERWTRNIVESAGFSSLAENHG